MRVFRFANRSEGQPSFRKGRLLPCALAVSLLLGTIVSADSDTAPAPATSSQKAADLSAASANAVAPAGAGSDVKPAESPAARPDKAGSLLETKPADRSASTSTAVPADPPGETLQQRIERWNKVNWAELAEKEPLRFLQLLRQRCAETVVDFTGTFYKQERVRGKLRDEESMEIKWRASPFSVYMKYTTGDKGREVLYVDGRYDNKLQAHPGGLLGPLIQLKLDPEGDRAMKDNLRPITKAGIPNMINNLVPPTELAERNGELRMQYVGTMEVGGRKVYCVKRILPEKDIYPCHELVVFVDVELLIPVGADSYMWDGQLQSKYRYTDVKLNAGLADEDFDRRNKSYSF